MHTISFVLSAPLQSYGMPTTTAYRRTYLHPTAETVTGLISAALGYRRHDPRIAKLTSEIKISYQKIKYSKQLTDYQIIQYRLSNKPGSKIFTKQSWRDYLQDSKFKIYISSSNSDLISEIQHALQHPQFALYIGRRSCPPDRPLRIERCELNADARTL